MTTQRDVTREDLEHDIALLERLRELYGERARKLEELDSCVAEIELEASNESYESISRIRALIRAFEEKMGF